jgi:dephospho-CoA kinase
MSEITRDLIVIGVVGRAGAGKDEVAEYLHRRCDGRHFTVGDIAREMAEERGVEKSRENLHAITEQVYEQKGEDYFIEEIIERIEAADTRLATVAGIRSPRDASVLREHFGDRFHLVAVRVADPHLRFERTRDRDDPRDPETFEAFKQQDQEEEELFDIGTTIQEADIILRNNGSLEDLHQLIENEIIAVLLAGMCG